MIFHCSRFSCALFDNLFCQIIALVANMGLYPKHGKFGDLEAEFQPVLYSLSLHFRLHVFTTKGFQCVLEDY